MGSCRRGAWSVGNKGDMIVTVQVSVARCGVAVAVRVVCTMLSLRGCRSAFDYVPVMLAVEFARVIAERYKDRRETWIGGTSCNSRSDCRCMTIGGDPC